MHTRFTRRSPLRAVVAAAALAYACGDSDPRALDTFDASFRAEDGGDDQSPAAAPLTIRVIRADTLAPIASARVQAGVEVARTDAEGFARFADHAPELPITVSAKGHVTALWSSAPRSVLEVPLTPLAPESPSARVRGAVLGLEALPTPAADHRLEVEVRPTLDLDLAGLTPALSAAEEGVARCALPSSGERSCAFDLQSRVGLLRIYALVFDVDTRGTDDTEDDTRMHVALGVSEPLTTTEGGSRSDVDVPLVADDLLHAREIMLASLEGAAKVTGVPGVKLHEGVMLFPGMEGQALLPAREGVVGEVGYWLIGEARYPDEGGDTRRVQLVRRSLEPDDLRITRWPEPLGAVRVRDGQLTSKPPADALCSIVTLRDAKGGPLLEAVLFDAPTLPLPEAAAGAALLEARSVVAPPQPEDEGFSLLRALRERSVELRRSTALAPSDP